MTDTVYGPILPSRKSAISGTTMAKLLLVIAIFILDFLLWPGYFGVSLALSALALFALKFAVEFRRTAQKTKLLAFGVFTVGVLPMIEVANVLTFLVGASFSFMACFVLSNDRKKNWGEQLDLLISSVIVAPFRFPKLCLDLKDMKPQRVETSFVLGWIIPTALCCVFVLLFAYASPIWQSWVEAIDLLALIDVLLSPRVIFWIFLAWVIWPFLQNKISKLRLFNLFQLYGMNIPRPSKAVLNAAPDGKQFVQRCLILFNLVFALQNVLDFGILWGGASLPEGMSYAEYSHRGAYPLVVAALLAALFVLFAMRAGGVGERSKLVRNLVLLWVGQNIILLTSSLLRLDIYITVYALTYWRIAAFIWMLLVGVGLVLIVARFVLQRSSVWLVIANLMVLAATLYVTSFVNFPYEITKFNLAQSSMARAGGAEFDERYLRRLGPNALPAVLEFQESHNFEHSWQLTRLRKERDILLKQYDTYSKVYWNDWRVWTFRVHRLRAFIEQHKKQEQAAKAGERKAP